MSAKHGNTPAAWTGVVLATIGFIVGSVGFLLGPQWTIVGIGAVLVLIAPVVGYSMRLAGLGEKPRKIASE